MAKVLCVDSQAIGFSSPDGSCWQHPYPDLQLALEHAAKEPQVHQIWVAAGKYTPTKTYSPADKSGKRVIAGRFSDPKFNPGITHQGQLIDYRQNPQRYNQYLQTFTLVDKVDIVGGFQGQSHPAGGEQSLAARSKDIMAHQTVLSGKLPSGEKVWHVVTAGNDITLQGVRVTLDRLVITDGDATFGPYYPHQFPLKSSQIPIYYHDDGGGLYVATRSQLKLKDVLFINNRAIAGGAIFAHDGSKIILDNCIFRDNQAENGSAITIRNGGPHEHRDPDGRVSTLIMNECQFDNNQSPWQSVIHTTDTYLAPPPGLDKVQIQLSE